MSREKNWVEDVLSFWGSRVFPSHKFRAIVPLGPAGELELGWILARVSFSMVIWVIGVLFYAFDGLLFLYLTDLQTLVFFLGIAPLVFIGAGGIYHWLIWFFPFVRPMLKSSDAEFEKFRCRIERYTNSFFPCLLLALVFFFVLTDVFARFELIYVGGLRLHLAWQLVSGFFIWVLIATGVWIIVSIWMAIFSMSRQPLSLELSSKTFKDFRALGLVSLSFSLFYFLAVAMAVFFPIPGSSSVGAPLATIVAIYSFFALVGVVGAILPFYNIHKVFVKLKKTELRKIEEAEKLLLQELDNVVAKPQTCIRGNHIGLITARLIGLQTQERNVRGVEEWPVDISFFSTLAAIVLIPLIIELITRIFLS